MEVEFKLEEFNVQYNGDRAAPRTIRVWKLSSETTVATAKPVVVASGFGRSMDQMGGVAANLVANGLVVYRYDSLDHVGMSDGEMVDFTLSTGLLSLEVVVDWVAKQYDGAKVGLVATSMMGRIAYRFASLSEKVSYLVTAVGVVHLRKTLKSVIGVDYSTYDAEDLPVTVEFERQSVGARDFYNDFIDNNWLSRDVTAEELKNIDVPVTVFIANDDEWVERFDIEEVIDTGSKSNRSIYIMEDCEHNFGKNLRSTEVFINRVTDIVCQQTMENWANECVQLGFEKILDYAIKERRMQRSFKRKKRVTSIESIENSEESCI